MVVAYECHPGHDLLLSFECSLDFAANSIEIDTGDDVLKVRQPLIKSELFSRLSKWGQLIDPSVFG